MYAIKKTLYFSVSALIMSGGSGTVYANDLLPATHTRHISMSESAPSYQIASVTWLPDYDDAKNLWNKFIISDNGNNRGHGDGCDPRFDLTACPQYADCDKCIMANKYYFKGCIDLYEEKPVGSRNCVLSCVPDKCEGYNLDEKADSNAEYESCEPGCGLATKYKFLQCNSGYSLEGGKCAECAKTQTEGSCPDGKTIDISSVCVNKSGVEVGDCVDCTSEKGTCNGYKLCGTNEVSAGNKCKCGNKTYYSECFPCNKTEKSCNSGKTLVNKCQKSDGETYGDCVDCRDENSSYNPCKGYILCQEGTVPDGETCSCGSQVYAERCLVAETCLYEYKKDSSCTSGIRERISGQCYSKGYYLSGSSCKSVIDGNTYYSATSGCGNGFSKDPCTDYYSSSVCENYGGINSSKTCSCGGKTYYKCKDECMYKYRESTPEENCAGGIWMRDSRKCYYSTGYFLSETKDTCMGSDGKKYYSTWSFCNASYTDDAPCKDFNSSSNCSDYGGVDETSESCSCGGETFYKKCMRDTKDPKECTYRYRKSNSSENCASGIWDRDANSCYSTLGECLRYSSCTDGGKTYYSYTSSCATGSCGCPNYVTIDKCNELGKGSFAGGGTCECGGITYYKACMLECSFEETEATCRSKGKRFTFKCAGSGGQQYGECS